MSKIVDITKDILERADEAKADYEADRENLVNFGRLLAFTEALSAIKCEYLGESKIDELLDFDIDKRYTCT